MIDIGVVLYKKGDKPGTLEAQWRHTVSGHGTGKATGNASGNALEGFAGHYQIRYFDGDGNVDADLELTIEQNGERYDLTWFHEGNVTARGIGIEVDGGLAAGWRTLDKHSAGDSA